MSSFAWRDGRATFWLDRTREDMDGMVIKEEDLGLLVYVWRTANWSATVVETNDLGKGTEEVGDLVREEYSSSFICLIMALNLEICLAFLWSSALWLITLL